MALLSRSDSGPGEGETRFRFAGTRKDWAADGSHRDPFTRRLWPWTSHFLLVTGGTLLWIYFFCLNRTTVVGRSRVRILPNTLIVANHQSSIDSVLIWLAATFPACLFNRRLMPWSLAAAEHFYRTPVQAWFSDQLRCIPVRGRGRDQAALRRLIEVLADGATIFFPEGTRSRNGNIGCARPGVGVLVLKARPRVIPVAIDGMHRAVGYDRFSLGFFRRIRISFGDPLECADQGDGRFGRAAAQSIADTIMDRIRIQHRLLRAEVGASASGEGTTCCP